MRMLHHEHTDLCELYYDEGFHAVQRSSHVFNGLSTDLVIQQVLMAVLKGRSGLTLGRGLSEAMVEGYLKVCVTYESIRFVIVLTCTMICQDSLERN